MTKIKDNERSEYFQTISRHFFRHRGSPFFLSSKDLDLITRWERMGIPLRVVIEGITRYFESRGSKRDKQSKILSLSYCQAQVVKSFQQYKERKVGSRRNRPDSDDKRKKARAEVKMFLKIAPIPVTFLKNVYSRAYQLLSQRQVDEGRLERLDEEVERLLVEKFLQEDPGGGEQKDTNTGRKDNMDQLNISKKRAVKQLRERHKIPYISLFYY